MSLSPLARGFARVSLRFRILSALVLFAVASPSFATTSCPLVPPDQTYVAPTGSCPSGQRRHWSIGPSGNPPYYSTIDDAAKAFFASNGGGYNGWTGQPGFYGPFYMGGAPGADIMLGLYAHPADCGVSFSEQAVPPTNCAI